MKTILVVDDEPSMVKGLRFNLEQQEGFNVDDAFDGEEALNKFNEGKYDLILLDLMLPKIDGMEVCQRIRSVSDVPIIMLTAKDSDIDKIMGLEYGADDYLTKPFNMLELKARIKSVLRRSEGLRRGAEKDVIHIGSMAIHVTNRSVEIDGKEIGLTAKEFDILYLFATNRGKVYDRENLLEKIWKFDYPGGLKSADESTRELRERTVDVHIRRLREKIEKNPAKPEYILTKWGVGYYFTAK